MIDKISLLVESKKCSQAHTYQKTFFEHVGEVGEDPVICVRKIKRREMEFVRWDGRSNGEEVGCVCIGGDLLVVVENLE